MWPYPTAAKDMDFGCPRQQGSAVGTVVRKGLSQKNREERRDPNGVKYPTTERKLDQPDGEVKIASPKWHSTAKHIKLLISRLM